jgi:hypothetical protein
VILQKPRIQLKQLHWKKLDDDAKELLEYKNSVWGNGSAGTNSSSSKATDIIAIDAAGITELFRQKRRGKPSKSSGKKGDKPAAEASQEAQEVVLFPNKGYGVDIFLARLRMDNAAICRAMAQMNENVLNPDRLQKFIKFVPTAKEIQTVVTYMASKGAKEALLSKTARFFYALRTVRGLPDLKTRLTLFLFKQQFDELCSTIQVNLDKVHRASRALQQSASLKTVLRLILAIGNHLNAHTRKGNARGFRLETLAQLKSTKTSDNKLTLLQYVVQIVRDKYPDAMQLCKELSCLASAARIEAQFVESEVRAVALKLRKVTKALKMLGADEKKKKEPAAEDDEFKVVMGSWSEHADKDVKLLQTKYKECQEHAKSSVAYFGQPVKELVEGGVLQWHVLFERFAVFVAEVSQADKFLTTREKQRKKQAQRASMELAVQTRRKNKAPPPLSPMEMMARAMQSSPASDLKKVEKKTSSKKKTATTTTKSSSAVASSNKSPASPSRLRSILKTQKSKKFIRLVALSRSAQAAQQDQKKKTMTGSSTSSTSSDALDASELAPPPHKRRMHRRMQSKSQLLSDRIKSSGSPKADSSALPPCRDCGCSSFSPHQFKPMSCRHCFHKH